MKQLEDLVRNSSLECRARFDQLGNERQSGFSKEGKECYRCGGKGHFQRDCSSRRSFVVNSETVPLGKAQARSPALRKYLLTLPQFKLIHDVLYYQWKENFQESLRLLVPFQMRKEIMGACHEAVYSGHHGKKRTLERMKKKFHLYNMSMDVSIFVRKCHVCDAEKKSSRTIRARLQTYICGAPIDRIQLDVVWPFPISDAGNKYILVIIDQFTKWVEAYPITQQDSNTTAKKLVLEFISRLGVPLEIHTDQGRNFQSALFKEQLEQPMELASESCDFSRKKYRL